MKANQKYDIYTPNVIDVGFNVQTFYFSDYYNNI